DLNGSYECNASTCGWGRDLTAFESTITNQDFEGVLSPPGVTVVTLLGGFKIVGKDGMPPVAPGSVGVTIAGSAPTLRGNKIVGGNVTGGGTSAADRSIGVAVRSTGSNIAQIENNDITGGSAIGLSAALTLEQISGVNSSVAVTSNVLRGGTARRSDGIAAFGAGAGTIISNNDITSGNSQSGASNGIETSSSLVIDGNRINADAATVGTCTQSNTWCAGIASFGGTLTITNNVVYGPKAFRATAVFLVESEIPAGTVVVNGNYLNGGGLGGVASGTTRNASAGVVVSIGPCNTCGLKGMVGRIRNNIIDGGINLDRYGVREDPAQNRTQTVEVLQANDIWFSTNLSGRNDTFYRQVGSFGTPVDIKSIVVLNNGTNPVASLNINADPQVDATWHIGAQSPCINAGVPTESPGKDFEGDTRPGAGVIDMGADERP
ncbi:MAG: choice-of-anchor Q domain-containing protein, partial [Polyangiales bacterium]